MDTRQLFSNPSNSQRPRFSISRKAVYWMIASVLTLAALLIWAVIASAQWLLHQGKDAAVGLINDAPTMSQSVLGKVEQVIPGAKQAIENAVPEAKETLEGTVARATDALGGVLGGIDLTRSAQREVSGTDIVPIARFSGLVRVAWDQSGMAQYEGKADFKLVRDHYSTGFIKQGFTETSISANQETEVHEYVKGQDRYKLTTTQKSPSIVQLTIEKVLLQQS